MLLNKKNVIYFLIFRSRKQRLCVLLYFPSNSQTIYIAGYFFLSVEAIHLDIYNCHEMNVSSCKFNKKVFILKASLSVLSIRVGIRSFVYFMPIN